MYAIRPTTQFNRDLKRAEKRGCNIDILTDVIKKLASGERLEEKYRDHSLKGQFLGCRECHLTPDWLLIYEIEKNELILHLIRTGSHSELF
ncbi:MAG: type II toxin-antitoxin system YafQ family toxin [Methanomassiliicoccaceae archaeon]|nr:type II toxin-antitoxin system YafQ family toxin [Methanomassiliicoccaceae archaeon]MCL2318079.1 type II toxin-antitoxin system YafQ family toxin [Methanomassiliicoccaceae archaeon]